MKKNKIIGALVLVLLFSSSLFAQGITGKGIKLGLNFANWVGDDADIFQDQGIDMDKKMEIGFAFGGFLTYEVNEMFAIQPEILYSMQGVKYEGTVQGVDMTSTNTLTYIQVPILAKFNLSMESNIKPNIFLGPQLGLLLTAKTKAKSDGLEVEGDIKDATKSIDVCLVFGAGVQFDQISIDARYNMGLTSFDEGGDDLKNSVISIMLGYSY